jgi:biopolymer transport protein ExbD
MNLQPQRSEEPDINLTPLIDVVFLLLIFFMVSTTFKHETQLSVELPEAAATPVESKQNEFELVINAEGKYFIDDKAVVNPGLKTLMRAIEKYTGGDTDIPFIIRADAKTPHQAVITAMDVASRLGYEKISIATVQPKD